MLNNAKKCYLCGSTDGLHVHHIFFGTSNRKKSEKYKEYCTCYLCYECHDNIHRNPKWKEFDRLLKGVAQDRWCEGERKGIDEFIKVFGKNYMVDEDGDDI